MHSPSLIVVMDKLHVHVCYPVFQVLHQLGSLMDWFSTALDIAGIPEPSDRIIDGISLLPVLKDGKTVDRY